MGHLDVVPVEPGTEARWTHPPFAGVIDERFVWGRGALDDKMSVLAIAEAVERLLADGFAPRRTVYLAFGHDEEVGGAEGAGAIAGLLAERGIRLAYTIDEGMGIVARGLVPAVPADVALIGIAEKGYLTLEVVASASGGHSSTPPPRDRGRAPVPRPRPPRGASPARGDPRAGGGDVRSPRRRVGVRHAARAAQPLAVRPAAPRGPAPRARPGRDAPHHDRSHPAAGRA